MKKQVLIIVFLLIPTLVWGAAQDRRISDNDGTVLDIQSDGSLAVDIDDISAGTQTNDIKVEGGVAEDSASTEPPIHIGGIAESTVPTEVSDGDAIGAWIDTFGRLLIKGFNPSTGALQVEPVSAPPVDDACTHLLDVTVNANGESFNGTMFIGDADKITIYVWNTETVSSDDSEVNVTIELSPDGTALMTAQTGMINSEDQAAAVAADWTFDATEERYFWFPQPITAYQLKATVTCDADCDGSDYHVFDLWVCTNE